MHPNIAEFPNSAYYGGQLVSVVEMSPAPAGYAWPTTAPVCFEQCHGREESVGSSFSNFAEATRVVEIVDAFLKGGSFCSDSITVITPYVAQTRLIQRLLERKRLAVEAVVTVDKSQGLSLIHI